MIRACVITVSDSRFAGQNPDTTGPAVEAGLEALGLGPVERRIVPDETHAIRDQVKDAARRVPLVVTTGGTGIGPRDVTPEAIRPLFDRELPGFGELMRTEGFASTPLSVISRGGAGIVGRALVLMLPGSPGAVQDGLTLLGPAIRHVLKILSHAPADCDIARRPAG